MTVDLGPTTEEEGKYVRVGGADLHYHELGTGEPTILIHGGGPGASGLSNYRLNAAALARGRRVLVVDLPGFGRSPVRAIPGSIFATMAATLFAFMDALGVERASLVGNSLGGGTALRMALDAPGRVSRLVLMGTGGSLPLFTPYPTEGMQRIAGFYEGEGPTLEKLRRVLELLVFDQTRLTDELVHERFAAATRPDVIANPPMRGRGGKPVDALWREPLGSVTQSTLLLWGREDRVMPLDAAFVLLKALPLAELHVFPQCGHWVQWEQAARFNALVSEFLDAGGGTA